jgi:hypothetical protein
MTPNKHYNIIQLIIFAAYLTIGIVFGNSSHDLPVTGATQALQQPNLQAIQKEPVAKVNTVTQVSVTGKFTFSVVQSGNSAPAGNLVGQYAYAANKGNIGLLAHNYAAGSSFYAIANGDEVIITFGNGRTKSFVVNNALRFQATDPNNFNKPFLDSNGKEMSPKQVFNQAYKSNGLTFQTCIENNGSSTWGLLFVQAVPNN